jgi:hypothetical protein
MRNDRLTVFGAAWHSLDCSAQPSIYRAYHLRGVHYCGCLQRIGVVMNNDDDTNSGGDFFFDLMKTLVALLFFILFILVMGTVVGGLASWF